MATELMEKPIPVKDEEQAQITCIHHWLIDPPDSPTSMGVCLKCGAEREFRNYFAHSIWESESEAADGGIDLSFLGEETLSTVND